MKQTYIDYFQTNWRFLVILLAAGLIVSLLLKHDAEREPKSRAGFSAPEWLFVSLLTALPAHVLPVSYVLHAYRADYVLGFAIGLGTLLVALFAEQSRRSKAAGFVVMILFAAVTLKVDLKTLPDGIRALVHRQSVHAALAVKYDSDAWVRLLEASDLPVVVGDHLLYTRLDCYALDELKRRLFFLTDFAKVSKYPLSETSQRNFLLFGKLLRYQTMDIGIFVLEHRHFELAVGEVKGTLWAPQYILNQATLGNASLRLLGPGFEEMNVCDVQFNRLPEFHVANPLQ